ncbi:MAG: hypothetical protein O9318_15090 [Hylemonella sp.]|uniref:hypothetical protein n=1 Tax=Hylemonella sp. TaxID=2066020 RepID=UPI0022BCEEC8|nr:hypothetical protein [Hylemonella sp.]MCZ8253791.1 hypothetical protein [Hylemonella sp.]
MGIWLELGIFVVVIAFGLWQLHDVRRAREQTRREKEKKRDGARDTSGRGGPEDGSG